MRMRYGDSHHETQSSKQNLARLRGQRPHEGVPPAETSHQKTKGFPNAILLDGGWEVRWSNGETAPIVIKGGSWKFDSRAYHLDLSDPSNLSFTWQSADPDGEPEGSQSAAINDAAPLQVQTPGFLLTWETDVGDTITWRRLCVESGGE